MPSFSQNNLEFKQAITRKYRHIAHLPDFLFAFTFPLRRLAIERLRLSAGDRVLEAGCSSGANFPLLVQAVSSQGTVVGIDLNPDMVHAANRRIQSAGWKNVHIHEAAAEEFSSLELFDALLLFAMHDVLTSPAALDNLFSLLKPGGRFALAGPKQAQSGVGRLARPLINQVYQRFAINTQDQDEPWRLAAQRYPQLTIEEMAGGLVYLVSGIS